MLMERVTDFREAVEKDIRDDWMRETDPVRCRGRGGSVAGWGR